MSMATARGANSPRFVSDVVVAANGHWRSVLAGLGVDVPADGKHGTCPACGGKDRFRFDDKGGRGTWLCNQCDPKAGDGLDLVVKAHGKSIKEAAELVASVLGISPGGLDVTELEHQRQQQRTRSEIERKQKEQQRRKAAIRAAALMRDVIHGMSPYLESKGLCGIAVSLLQHRVDVSQLTFHPGSLVVPLMTELDGDPVTVQIIDAEGNKAYLAGGQKAHAFHRIVGGPLVVICEGYATGLSIHLATRATVFCAMDVGNLLSVAKFVREVLNPEVLILAADNDANTPGNPGKTKADQAVAAVGGLVVIPPDAGDWNDYHQAHGLTQTEQQIMTQINNTKDQSAGQKGGTDRAAEVIPLHPAVENKADDLPEGFSVQNGMLHALEWCGRGEKAYQEEVAIASEIRVLAETSDETGRGHGRLLEWQDSTGHTRQWAMPLRALVPRNGEEVITALLDAGLQFVNLEKRRKLTAFLMACRPDTRVTCVERTGWHGRAYVLPGGNLGPEAERVILQSTSFVSSDFTMAGTLVDWQQQVAAVAVGNSRLCFALSLAFAAPLLSLVGLEGGGFHLKGESTDGKSTIMKASASIYGHPDRYAHTWRATGNAIEGIASRRNDALLCLDELGELDSREAGQVAYMLANGQGKGRSRQDGELRDRKAWRLLFLSTGELSLEDHAAEAGKRTQAGMEVRTIQIPSSTGHHGAFEMLHGYPGERAFADALNDACKCQYGTAFRAYIAELANTLSEHSERLRANIRCLVVELTPVGAGNQVGRAINRFALVAAAGELATELGITGWPTGEAIRAVRVCLKAWLEERGHLGNHEDAAALKQVRDFVMAHQLTRFADWHDKDHRPANMVGHRKVDAEGVRFYIPSAGWQELSKGRDPKRVTALCLGVGYLLSSKDKRSQHKVRLPGMTNTTWVYVLTERVLADAAERPEDE
ncbi:DUF927 domain-containing protein [Aeromonas bestiarum]|uniref:DUF927 domain-containing protein n=1 Tax=Aeromonas bestiarum TaxID=105751 RepID=UPI00259E2D96|nr:DUF927 domain-containing protein [Aeromonas bestiarum]MDM5087775.1 DUF927 domain-containing protein [Aeromonas bestiarum]